MAGKKLVPARLQNVTPPAPYEKVQAVDMIGRKGDVRDDRFAAFLDAVGGRWRATILGSSARR